jgi:hypothetical protein
MKAATFVCQALASCIVLGAGVTAQAGMSPFNPDNLSPTRLARVSQVCETVLGLSRNEPLEGGNRTGSGRLDYWTSHYRGCIVSLSDSLQSMDDARLPAPTVGDVLPAARGAFTYASPHETARREELACGSLGVALSRNEFNSCVSGLSQTFYSVDHPID